MTHVFRSHFAALTIPGRYLLLMVMLSLLLICLSGCFASKTVKSNSKPVSHATWDTLLKQHVSSTGDVDYQGFIKDSLILNEYLDLLETGHPNDLNWSQDEQLAYWINAYNAFTIQIVIRNYPVESIRDIGGAIPFVNSVWDIKFINVEGKVYDLNNIEHNILRKQFEEPRIHFALVCASYSCPRLLNEAFTAEKLETQLAIQAVDFINDPNKNQIPNKSTAKLSKIFSWYTGDFKKNGTLIEFLNQYAETPLSEDAKIDYVKYNWSLNEK